MAVRFKVLVPYRSSVDPRVWWRYEPITDEELKAHNEHVEGEHTEEEDEAHSRDLIAHVRELWFDGEKFDDPDDIADTMIEGSGSMLAIEAVRAMLRRAFVSDEDAPFRRGGAALDTESGG